MPQNVTSVSVGLTIFWLPKTYVKIIKTAGRNKVSNDKNTKANIYITGNHRENTENEDVRRNLIGLKAKPD